MEQSVAVTVRVEESAQGVLDALVQRSLKITVTIESAIYTSCCGAYEEKSLKVEPVLKIDGSSDFIRVGENIPIFVSREAFDLVKSRGNHFAIYAGADGKLYSDQ